MQFTQSIQKLDKIRTFEYCLTFEKVTAKEFTENSKV